MSFEAQERILFELLFDRGLRKQFAHDAAGTLAKFGLNADEQKDFINIRPEALELDASIRADLILSQYCSGFSITFSLVSSVRGGLDALKLLIDSQTMHSAPHERIVTFGTRLRDTLAGLHFDSPKERAMVAAIHEAELGMVWTSATLKRVALERGQPVRKPVPSTQDASNQPIHFAPYVSASLLPLPYLQLKQAFCPSEGSEFWRHLNTSPTSAALRKETFTKESPRVLVAQARVARMSPCEPTVDHMTAELSEGFAPLMRYVNGTVSIDGIVAQLGKAGASETMQQSVRKGFLQLLAAGMMEVAPPL